MPTVIVVPADRLIVVNGQGFTFEFAAPEGLHALHWNGSTGHTEWKGGPNKQLSSEEYDAQVAPFVALWEGEKARREASLAEQAAIYNGAEARFARLRGERDRRLAATDYLLMADYPLTETTRANILAYRTALRDLPQQPGAPWDGGEALTPWPVKPTL